MFEKQPRYSEDWRTCVQSILKVKGEGHVTEVGRVM